MKVYVITSGEYSDYHICAVTLDDKKAKILKEKFDHDDYTGASIEEFDTDDYNGLLIGKNVYMIRFSKSGDVLTIINCTERGLYSIDVSACNAAPYMSDDVCIVHVMARSPEAAIKIAAERRAKYLAEKMSL